MSASFRRYNNVGKPKEGSSSLSSGSTAKEEEVVVSYGVVAPHRGTKPWTGGAHLTSSGLREFDSILGGGQPIGTCLLVQEDRYTDLCHVLVRYWAAEALAQKQYLLLVETKSDTVDLPTSLPSSDELDEDDDVYRTRYYGSSLSELQLFINKLPRDAHLDKFRNAEAAQNPGAATPMFESIVEEEEEEEGAKDIIGEENQEEESLKIAWQYKLSIQNKRYQKKSKKQTFVQQKHQEIFCHSYDLSSSMRDQYSPEWFDLIKNETSPPSKQDDVVVNIGVVKIPPPFKTQDEDIRTRGFQLFRCLFTRIEKEVLAEEGMVLRLLFLNAPPCEISVALPLLLSTIRKKKLAVVLCVTVRPSSDPSTSLIGLQRASDFFFSIDGFDSFRNSPPSEFRNLSGILHVHKLQMSLNHFANKQPAAPRYGLVRDGRKLHLQMLHLPPEDFSSGGSSVSGARTGGGGGDKAMDVTCGSSRGSTSLDF